MARSAILLEKRNAYTDQLKASDMPSVWSALKCELATERHKSWRKQVAVEVDLVGIHLGHVGVS